jgi:hypothetical protein
VYGATLLIVTCPVFGSDIRFLKEAQAIEAIYGKDNCEIMEMGANNHPSEIYERINRPGSKISKIHFIGHGDLTSKEDENTLGMFDSETGVLATQYGPEYYASNVFHKESHPLELVFLNTCETISVGERIFQRGGAQTVICWDTRAQTDACKQLAEAFYRSLVNPVEGRRSSSVEHQQHDAFRGAKAKLAESWNVELNPDAVQFTPRVKKRRDEHGQLMTTMRTNDDGSGVTITGSTVIKPNKTDQRNRKFSGRPRILQARLPDAVPAQEESAPE